MEILFLRCEPGQPAFTSEWLFILPVTSSTILPCFDLCVHIHHLNHSIHPLYWGFQSWTWSINKLLYCLILLLFFLQTVATLPVTALIIDWESTYYISFPVLWHVEILHSASPFHAGWSFWWVSGCFQHFTLFPPPKKNNKTLLDVDFSIFRHVEILHSMTPSHAEKKRNACTSSHDTEPEKRKRCPPRGTILLLC